ncbi:MAG: 3-oxoacyl-[acyl-carrier-protein] reductase [Fimbriimonadaceae bacterium]|nr:3-oxoacyl-[acyl-carrier-protein] reductase [Fimbriimonadaceae bacterium]
MILNGKIAAVTGASRGIGQAIALDLARAGAQVACIATKEANAQTTVEMILAMGGMAKAYGCDVSQTESVEATFAAIASDLGAPAILVNNAGITRDTLMLRMKDDDWDQVMATNLRGAFLCTRVVTKAMMKAREGRIINITSIVGLHGAAGQANYAASKAGLVGLTLATAKELGARGITCNAVAPGFIETDMTHDLPQEMKEQVQKSAPLGRLGSPEDIAQVVTFLAGPGAGYMTGQVLTVDGGLTL